nr:5-(carboxyamino)imidazole ribonucleotide synthase [Arthrobacter roseus]
MMVPAAAALGIDIRVLAEAPGISATQVTGNTVVGDYKDLPTLQRFAQGLSAMTFDHEHVPAEHLQALVTEGVNVQPGPAALIHAQDKLVMRAAVDRLGLPNPEWSAVGTVEELVAFGERIGWPVVLKTPRGGYDGKGVRILDDPAAAMAATDWFTGTNLLAEQKVAFSRELSALIARSPSGETRAWPIAHSIQVHGVCDEVIAPAQNLDPSTTAAATEAAIELAEQLGVTGVMAVELFETPGQGPGFLINELAMRPHNSGHWTMDGAVTGQFEQHLRAVLDLPLGSTEKHGAGTIMKNYLGGSNQDLFSAYPRALAADPSAKIHGYGKSVRPGRKIGHVNVTAASPEALDDARASATRVADIISGTVNTKDVQ